ncbi:thiamine phosphate synthase [Pedobacter nutrimenti]|uniref:Thiamine-phosphate pyrophosphorylase n=1 Tax=Pedobacter nutrimenti TaxID=1241337 RepID=A0A318UMA9_9SPHI|nr:thiamine phosphate synthase [Pedobacter nutrimenti]PYF77133.1 thiamine-phosphate pyrophosphorylase [Pedobacter nutrimenti]
MQVIVVSNPASLNREPEIINAFFEHGLSVFHLRKPDYTREQLALLIQQIKTEYHSKIALHHHHELINEYKIRRLHYPEKLRKECPGLLKKPGYTYSTSIHNLAEYERISDLFDYVLLGPVFDSISKKGYKSIDQSNHPNKLYNKKMNIIGIGGITQSNGKKALEYGFNGLALMGYLWQMERPEENFKQLLNSWNTKEIL